SFSTIGRVNCTTFGPPLATWSWSWTKGGRFRVTCWRGRAARSEAWSSVALTSSSESTACAGVEAPAPSARTRAEARGLVCSRFMRFFLDIHVVGYGDIVGTGHAIGFD